MGRVLMEFGIKNAATELATNALTNIFQSLKIDVRSRFFNDMTEDDLNWCSSFIALRPRSDFSLEFMKKIKDSGRFFAAFYDDDLLNINNTPDIKVRRFIELSDIIISSNPLLAKEYSEIAGHKRFCIIHTPLEEKDFTDLHDAGKIARFVYAASVNNAIHFERLIKPVMNKFLDKNHDKVHFTFVGAKPNISGIKYQECFSFVELMPLEKYNEYMRENQFDIGLSPLPDERFCNRKYFNKFIEYSKVGITGLYSNCMPYTMIVEDGVNGFMVNNTPEDWLNAMQKAVDLKSELKNYAANAQKILREKFSLPEIAKLMLQEVPEFDISGTYKQIKYKRPSCKIMLYFFNDKVQKFLYVLRQEGIKYAFKRIINKFTRRRIN